MNEPDAEALSARLAVLEAANAALVRSNERIRTAGLLAASVLVVLVAAVAGTRRLQAAPPPSKPVDGDEVALKDKDGKTLGLLKTQESGQPLMALMDKTSGKVRIAVGLHPDGTPFLALVDDGGKDRAFLGLTKDGAPGLFTIDANGTPTHALRDEPVLTGEAGIRQNELAAIGALKTICTSQAIFREGDKEQDGNLDYGMLSELGDTKLVDAALGKGTKNGYLFQATYSFETSEFLWFAVANPQQPGKTGKRSFATNMAGVIFYADNKTLVLDTSSCLLPAQGVTPTGR